MEAVAGEGPLYEPCDDTGTVSTGEGVAARKHSLRRKAAIVAAGLSLGITARVIYIFIMVMLPAQESGAARLGERFTIGW